MPLGLWREGLSPAAGRGEIEADTHYAGSLFTLRLLCIGLNCSLLMGKISHLGIWDSLVRDEPALEGIDVGLRTSLVRE